jgi:hypothetical protein
MARVFTDGGAQALATASQSILNNFNWSIAFWMVRTATPAARRGIIGINAGTTDGFYVTLETTNLIQAAQVYSSDKIRSSSTTPTLNGWTHVVITHNDTGLNDTDFTFYFNGKSEAGTAVQTAIGTHTNGAQQVVIGNGVIGTLLAPPAQFGPFAFWNRAISPAEALALATGAHPLRFREGLVEIFDMAAAAGEEGWLQKLYLVQGATNPTSAAVNPPCLPPPSWITDAHINVRPMQRSRARYFVPSLAYQPYDLAHSPQWQALIAQ